MIKPEQNEWSHKEVVDALGYLNSINVRHTHQNFLSWINQQPSKTILDVGCGNGNLYHMLESNHAYTGIDINPYNIEFAKKQSNNSCEFLCDDVENIDVMKYNVLYFDSTLSFLRDPISLLQKYCVAGNVVFLTRLKLDSYTHMTYDTWEGMKNPSYNWAFCIQDLEKIGYTIQTINDSYLLESK